MKLKLIFLFITLCLATSAWAVDPVQDSIAYKLAWMHMRDIDPQSAFLKGKVDVPQAILSEFQWLIDSLKQRCLNPENAIADTIRETWLTLKYNGIDMSILDITRELSLSARNTNTFGEKKVNFRITSRYWLTQKLRDPRNQNKINQKK
jgi:hypothetical protein